MSPETVAAQPLRTTDPAPANLPVSPKTNVERSEELPKFVAFHWVAPIQQDLIALIIRMAAHQHLRRQEARPVPAHHKMNVRSAKQTNVSFQHERIIRATETLAYEHTYTDAARRRLVVEAR